MVICGQEFAFSLRNANDMDRLEDAIQKMNADAAADVERWEREHVRLGDRLRSQARICMNAIDKILGEGASDRLGLNENDGDRIDEVIQEIVQWSDAEKERHSVPLNRAQRRAQRKQHKHPQTVNYPVKPAAAQMVERVDKAARRKELLAQLAALENE